jgi:hypothetical protein
MVDAASRAISANVDGDRVMNIILNPVFQLIGYGHDQV